MEGIKPYISLLVIITVFLLTTAVLYVHSPNLIMAFVTFLVVISAIYLYIKQKEDAKRDTAKIILQEIRRAEDIISDYKSTGGYQFDKKIIATNSWTNNIHLFVGDLNNDELDKISDLYSTGEYLDGLIREISRIRLNDEIKREKKLLEVQLKYQQQHPLQLDGSTYPMAQVGQPVNIIIPHIAPVWKPLLDAISLKLEPIYHSEIVAKLKKIAQVK